MDKTSDRPVNIWQILIGVIFLLIGVLVYLIDRPPESTYFVYRYGFMLSLHNILPKIFGPFGNSLPDFIHVFSFILITGGIVSCGKRGCLIISLGWLFIDVIFELGQRYNSFVLSIIPDWFSGVPILEAVEGYFRTGTFDLIDMSALILGALAAYLVLLATMRRRERSNVKRRCEG